MRGGSWLAGILVLASGPALTGCEGSSRAPSPICAPMPATAAHRGGTETSLENTLAAFRSAGEAGITIWELDVRFDVTGTPVVLHDDTVDRISPLTGPVSKLDARNRGIPTDDGQYVPSLREVYDLARRYRAHVLTEIKITPTGPQWQAIADQIDDTVGRSAVTLVSFEGPVVLQAKRRLPGTATALVNDGRYLSPEQVHRYGDAYLQAAGSITAARARGWHAAGIALYAWTVDSPAEWGRLSAWPVDVFVTNRPIAYEQWAERRCRSAPRPDLHSYSERR